MNHLLFLHSKLKIGKLKNSDVLILFDSVEYFLCLAMVLVSHYHSVSFMASGPFHVQT